MPDTTRDPNAAKPNLDEIGYQPDPGNPGGQIDQSRVITSSGEAPTGGTPVGGAADRVIPDPWAARHGSATNVTEDEES